MAGKSKWIAGLLIMLLLVSAAMGCGKEKHPGKVKNEPETAAVESTQEKETKAPETEHSETAAPETKEQETEATESEIQETEALETEAQDTEAFVSEDEIRPEVKEALDSYEEMMNEYCDFMEKYSESDDITEMMGDYLEMMKVYANASEKLDQIDEEELTDAETMYYLEVTNRIEKRLLEVSAN